MKKFQYYLTAIFFALFATVSFTACYDDEEEYQSTVTCKRVK